IVSSVWLTASGQDPAVAASPTPKVPPPQRIVEGTTLETKLCHQPATHPFVPATITITGITDDAPVLSLCRCAHPYRQPKAPPLTEAGKHEFAWTDDSPPPGSAHGNTLLNAHTWPWSSAPALGNLMIEHLHRGDLIVVRGEGQRQCYRVTEQDEVGVD